MPQSLLQKLKQKYSQINLDQKVDQVVSMIFRQINPQQIQLLYVQRAYSQKDHYSGDVCFPGGNRQKGQTCFQTAVRETQEQTGIKLKKQHYIGTLDFTFTTKVGKSMVRGQAGDNILLCMGILMFQIGIQESERIVLSVDEMRAYKWVNIKEFFQGNCDKFQRWDIVHHPLLNGNQAKLKFPAYDIGMDRFLWGLTFYSTALFVASVSKIKQQIGDLAIKIDKQFVERFYYHCTDLLVQGDLETQQFAKKKYIEGRVGFMNSKL